jgi:hypothetical protein
VSSALIRCALVALAIVAGAWLVVGYRAVDLEAEAGTVPSLDGNTSLSPAELEHARSALRDARLLSVDKEPLLNEGLLLFATGRREEGLAIAEGVVAEEPNYVEGWTALYYMRSLAGDGKRAARAARKVQARNPLAGDALREAGQ